MDKKLVLAVAGSGKTRNIVESLSADSRALIVTYTNNNADTLRVRILEKFGVIPGGIQVHTYFTFIYNFCYLPIFQLKHKNRGIMYEVKPPMLKGVTSKDLQYYQSVNGYLYSDRLALLLSKSETLSQVQDRLKEFYDYFIVDEIQDFGSHDIEFLLGLATTQIGVLFVGDYYQHTFTASQDGAKKKNLYKGGYENFIENFKKHGALTIDTTSLHKTWRCSPTICRVVRDKLGIDIESNLENETNVIDLFDDEDAARLVLEDNDIKKLFLRKHYDYNCYACNWGESKGAEFKRVCIVFSDQMVNTFRKDKTNFAPLTKSKLYVALTRTLSDVYLVRQDHAKYLLRQRG